MAGGVLKGFGALFLVLGIILLIAGIAGAIYASTDERDNQETGPFGVGRSDRRSDENEQIMMAAAAAGGVGLVLTILGTIFLVGGGARSRNQMERALRESRPVTLVTPAPGAQAEVVPLIVEPLPPTPFQEEPTTRRGLVAGLVIGGVLLLAVIVLFAMLSSGDGGLLGDDGPFGTSDDFGTQSLQGSTNSSVAFPFIGPQSLTDGDPVKPLTVPSGTGRIQLTIREATGDVAVSVEQQQPDGTWAEVYSGTGAAGQAFNYTASGLDDAPLRVFVRNTGTATQGADFKVEAHYWRD